jgi:MFS family permease
MDLSTGVSVKNNSVKKQIGNTIYISLIAFLTYASVYAYRKPFTVATFDDIRFLGIPYQTLLIISQVIGYMLSKFYGIRFIAELKKIGRWKTALLIISIAWIALFFFALTPAPYGILFLFINGFVLGLMWGIVFSYVEGRRATDIIGSVLAVSIIFAGGFTRSIAKWLVIEWGVNEYWMPFMTGLVFIVPLIAFIFLLERSPAPNQADEMQRTVREPMNKKERRR